jgi:hypothetical protein
MSSRSSRLLALLLESARRRLVAGLLATLLIGLSFGCGYIAAQTIGEVDVLTPVDQPLVATVDREPAIVAAPQSSGAGIVVTRSSDLEVRPLRPAQDRAPPSLTS